MVWKFGRIAISIIILIFSSISFAEDLFADNVNDIDKLLNKPVKSEFINTNNIIKEELPLTAEEHALINYNKGLELLRKSQEVEAAILFKKILEEFPKHHKSRMQLVQLYQKIGWLDEIEKLLQTGLDLAPIHEDFIKNLAVIYIKKNQPRKALAILLTMPEYNEQQTEYLSLLAITYLNADQADMAEKYYQQLVAFNKKNSTWWLGLAVAQDANGKYKNSLESFNQAKAIGRFNAEILDYINGKVNQILKYAY